MQYTTVSELFDLSHTIAAPLLRQSETPWQALPRLKEFVWVLGAQLPAAEFDSPEPGVWIAKDASVAPTAHIGAPCIIDHGAEVRHCAFIRGSAIVGKNAVVGNSTELKNVILFDSVQAPHYNYVGDSILGYHAHMGAGAVTSNVKGDKTPVVIHGADGTLETGLKKAGAMLGDHAAIGCNTVLNPGAVVGRRSQVYPLSSVRGVVPADHIYKDAAHVVQRRAAD